MARQTRLPDELIVCDDRSSDRSMEILHAFAGEAPFPVKVTQNARTLGSTANFEQAMRLCAGDLIALSDQDDIWYPNRLQRCEMEFLTYPDAGLVFSDAELIDEQGHSLGKTLWQRLGFAGERKQELLQGHFVILAKHRFVTGATVMFRASLRNRVLPIADGWIHDEWITLITAAFADLRSIEETLIRYRIHGTQLVGLENKLAQRARGTTPAEKHWARLAESVKELQQMCDVLGSMVLPQGRGVLPAYRRHLQFLAFRYGLPAARIARVLPILKRHALYREHASGLASMIKDMTLNRVPPSGENPTQATA